MTTSVARLDAAHRLFCRAIPWLFALTIAHAFWNIHTLALVSDPAYYLGLARSFTETGTPPSRIAPGFILWLSAWMKIGGPASAFFANIPLVITLIILMTQAGLRCTGSFLHAWLGTITAFAAAWITLPSAPHFLLYPFRETATATLLFAAVLTLTASPSPRIRRVLLGAGLIFAAGLVRENALVAVLPFIAWCAWKKQGKVLLMCALAALTFTTLALLLFPTSFDQGLLYLRSLVVNDTSAMLPSFGAAISSAFQQWTHPLLACIAVLGMWRAARQRTAIHAWLLSIATLSFLLLALTRITDRYTLFVLLFLGPLAGWQFAFILERLANIRPFRNAPCCRFFVHALCLVFLVVLSISNTCLKPWGPRLGWNGLHEIRQQAEHLPDVPFVVEEASRHLAAFSAIFRPWKSAPPSMAQRPTPGLGYWDALTPFCFDANHLQNHHLLRTYLIDQYDLTALPNRPTIHMGEAAWEAKILAPFSAHSRTLDVPSSSWMALDLRSTLHPQGLEIILPANPSKETITWNTPPAGPGWIILHIPPDAHGTWTLRSKHPLPAHLAQRFDDDHQGFVFDLGSSREMSEARLLGENHRARLGRDGALVAEELPLRLPPIFTNSPSLTSVDVRLWFQWIGKQPLHSVRPPTVQHADGTAWETRPGRSSSRAVNRHNAASNALGTLALNQPSQLITLTPTTADPPQWLFLLKITLMPPTSPTPPLQTDETGQTGIEEV